MYLSKCAVGESQIIKIYKNKTKQKTGALFIFPFLFIYFVYFPFCHKNTM